MTLDAGWLEAVMLAGVRMVAFLVIAPPFSHNAIPLRIKAMLAARPGPGRLTGTSRPATGPRGPAASSSR